MRKNLCWMFLVGLIGLGAAGSEAKEALVVLATNDLAVTKEIVRVIEEKDGRIKHVLAPHILIGDVPQSIVGELETRPEVDSISYGLADSEAISERYGPMAGCGAKIWNANYASPPKARPDEKGKPKPLINDALIPPRPTQRLLFPGLAAEKPIGAGDGDTSDFMVGRIAVAVILPESNSATDTSTENWDSQRENTVVSQIQGGMNWWAEKAPEAQLQFWYKYFLPSNAPATVSTGYEPVNRPQSDEKLWINEIMIKITGHSSGTYMEKVRYYNNQIRNEFDTDWALTVFVVDSLNDPDGEFADDYFAYAWVGGPFLVMTYDNDNWGIGNMDKVCAHEMGHIFYALDEYSVPNIFCTTCSGYLNVENGNYADCGNEPCIMRSEGGADAGHACHFTRGQVGLWTKPDGALTVLGTATILLGLPEGTSSLRYHGTATILPQPAINQGGGEWNPPATCTNGQAASVQYEASKGTWSSGWKDATATDGQFNSQNEAFDFTLPPLSNGIYTVKVQVLNSIGRVVHLPYATSTVIITWAPREIKITNISGQQFAVSWITDSPAISQIKYGTTPAFDLGIIDDERGEGVKSETHQVKITGLTPETMYYYQILSDKIACATGTVTTGPDIAGQAPNVVHGKAYLSGSTTVAEGAIVCLRIFDNDGTGTIGSSSLYSVLVDSGGYWCMGLNNFRTHDQQAFFKYSSADNLWIYVQGASKGTAALVTPISQTSPSFDIVIPQDFTPPSAPLVSDGGKYTKDNTQLQAYWTASIDQESGILEYQYAIGTWPGATDTVSFSWIGATSTSVIQAGLNLTEGLTYFFTVKARNRVGLWSEPGTSNGITVDTSPPTFTVTIVPPIAKEGTVTITVKASEPLDQLPTLTIKNSQGNLISWDFRKVDNLIWYYWAFPKKGLNSDGVATIEFTGRDGAGNSAPGSATFVLDTVAQPNYINKPAGGVYVKKNWVVNYTLGEDMAAATITLTRTGGTEDISVHAINLTNLTAGTFTIPGISGLQGGAIYSISLNSIDLAGNPAPPVTKTNIAYLAVDSYAELPNKMRQTNITGSQFTISWITPTPTTGYIKYGLAPESVSTIVQDDRGASVIDTIHHVTIKGRDPETTYYYDLFSGNTPENLNGIHYTIETGVDISRTGSDIANGRMYKADGITLAEGVIVYLRLINKDGRDSEGSSAENSVLVKSDGYWVVGLNNFRTQGNQSFFEYSSSGDELSIYAEGGGLGTESLSVDTNNDSPAPTIALGPPNVRFATYHPCGTLTLCFNEPVSWDEAAVLNNIRLDNDDGGSQPDATLTTGTKIIQGTPSDTLTIIISQPGYINSFSNLADLDLVMGTGIVKDAAGNGNPRIGTATNLSVNYLVEGSITLSHHDNKGTLTLEIPVATQGIAIGVKTEEEIAGSLREKIDQATATHPKVNKVLAAYEFKALTVRGTDYGTFTNLVKMEVPYQDKDGDGYEDTTGVKVILLRIYRLDETTSRWVEVENQGIDEAKKVVWGKVLRFSVYALAISSRSAPHLSKEVPVYPNPFSPAHSHITFGSYSGKTLTEQVSIKIFNLAGELVHSEELIDCKGEYLWKPGNIASGIYIYLITNPAGEKCVGKLAIIR